MNGYTHVGLQVRMPVTDQKGMKCVLCIVQQVDINQSKGFASEHICWCRSVGVYVQELQHHSVTCVALRVADTRD